MKFATRILIRSACGLLVSTTFGCGASRADDVGPLGEFALYLVLKGDDGRVRPIGGVGFDLTCAGVDAFSSRICTDAEGRATTYARPGKCRLKSRSPVRRRGKSYTWTGNVEFFPTKETRLDLSEENALVQDDEDQPAVPDQLNLSPPPLCGDEPHFPTGDVILPVVVRTVEPEYPPGAFKDRTRLPGKVICQAVIDTDGHVRNVTVVTTSNPVFNASAIRAVSGRRYIPAQSYGHAVAVYFTIRLDYR